MPPALARQLRAAGHVAEHVADLGMADADDSQIWMRAEALGAAILTKDEDFATRKALAGDGPPVVWIRLGNTRRAALLRHFEDVLLSLVEALERGEPLVEVS